MAFVSRQIVGLRSAGKRLAHARTRAMKVSGIVFDLDGCLTEQGAIDFKEMRRRIGIGPGVDILGHVEGLPDPERDAATAAILEVEAEGLERMVAREGLDELFKFLDERELRRALLTRNTHHALDQFKALSGKFFHDALDRSFTPPKPSPAALLEICKRWAVAPEEVIMIGDHSDDIECGRRAGSTTIQIRDDVPEGDEHRTDALSTPHYSVQSLPELKNLLVEIIDS